MIDISIVKLYLKILIEYYNYNHKEYHITILHHIMIPHTHTMNNILHTLNITMNSVNT